MDLEELPDDRPRFGDGETESSLFLDILEGVTGDRPRFGDGETESSLFLDILEGVTGDRPRFGDGETESSLFLDILEGVTGDRPRFGDGETESSLFLDILEGVTGDRPRFGDGETESSLFLDILEGVTGDRPRFGDGDCESETESPFFWKIWKELLLIGHALGKVSRINIIGMMALSIDTGDPNDLKSDDLQAVLDKFDVPYKKTGLRYDIFSKYVQLAKVETPRSLEIWAGVNSLKDELPVFQLKTNVATWSSCTNHFKEDTAITELMPPVLYIQTTLHLSLRSQP
ncbi:hypothetical protein BY996DRAFT_6408360 [Phakopsora pachyrhizi]|nr:hypothetical protein BY996DRAFT_6408360 [Phakopsora pachyrhizi]